MGNITSHWSVIDYSANRQHSTEHRIDEWEDIPPKNNEYYDGTRFFKVPRHLYPSYTRGWLYGYLPESADYWKSIYEEQV
jgi:hypothetical protein